VADDTAPEHSETLETTAGNLGRDRRFREVVDERNSLREQVAALQARQGELETQLGESAGLQGQLNDALANLGTARFTVDAYDAGLRGESLRESVAVAQVLHKLLPEEDRPSEIDWIKSLAKDPSRAPVGLRPYFGTTTATTETADTTTTTEATATATATATAQGDQGGGGMSSTSGGRIPGSENQIGNDLTREQKRQIGLDMQSKDPAVAAKAQALWRKYQSERV
jgi:hypothetical protein